MKTLKYDDTELRAHCVFVRLIYDLTDKNNAAQVVGSFRSVFQKGIFSKFELMNSPYGMYIIIGHYGQAGAKDAIDVATYSHYLLEKKKIDHVISICDGKLWPVNHDLIKIPEKTYIGRALNESHRIAFVSYDSGKIRVAHESYTRLPKVFKRFFDSNILIGKIEKKPGEWPFHLATPQLYEEYAIEYGREEIKEEKLPEDNPASVCEQKILLFDIAKFTDKSHKEMLAAIKTLWDSVTQSAEHLQLRLENTGKKGAIRCLTAGDAIAIFSGDSDELLYLAEAVRHATQSKDGAKIGVHISLAFGEVSADEYPIGPGLAEADKLSDKSIPVGVIALSKEYWSMVKENDKIPFQSRIQPVAGKRGYCLLNTDECCSMSGILAKMGEAKNVCVISNRFLLLRSSGRVQEEMVDEIITELKEKKDRKYTYILLSSNQDYVQQLINLFKNKSENDDAIMKRISCERFDPCEKGCHAVTLTEGTEPHIVLWANNHAEAKDGDGGMHITGAITLPVQEGDDFAIKYSKWIELEQVKAEKLCKMIRDMLNERGKTCAGKGCAIG